MSPKYNSATGDSVSGFAALLKEYRKSLAVTEDPSENFIFSLNVKV